MWFKALVYCHCSLSVTLPGDLLLPCVVDIPQLLPILHPHVLQEVTDGMNIGIGQHIILVLVLGCCMVGQPTNSLEFIFCWPYTIGYEAYP